MYNINFMARVKTIYECTIEITGKATIGIYKWNSVLGELNSDNVESEIDTIKQLLVENAIHGIPTLIYHTTSNVSLLIERLQYHEIEFTILTNRGINTALTFDLKEYKE